MRLKIEGISDCAELLCLGPVNAFYDKPMLEAEGWRQREQMDVILGQNQYPIISE
ncbi:MAG: hypothetical protein Q9M20_02490 [Mariprofundaceae bacterium]|nr:hypothetical protein [Mariprofundaceae bacterium]